MCELKYFSKYSDSTVNQWAGQRSRFSDWLRAGRSGDRIPMGARFSAPVQTGPGAHPSSCTVGAGSFPGVNSSRGVKLTPHTLLVPWSRERLEQYLYSPYGPYGLYRASVPVQGCTLPLSFFTVTQPIPVVTWSKAQVCGRSPTEIVGSIPTGGMDVCLL